MKAKFKILTPMEEARELRPTCPDCGREEPELVGSRYGIELACECGYSEMVIEAPPDHNRC